MRLRISRRMVMTLGLVAALVSGSVVAAADPGDTRFTNRTVIQPGAAVYFPELDTYCTAGYLLRDRAAAVYAVTGAHCAPDGRFREGAGVYTAWTGSRTWAVGRGPVVARNEPRHRRWGHFVAQHIPDDFGTIEYAIVRLDKGVTYDGTVAVLGGPARKPFEGETAAPASVGYVCMDGYAASLSQDPSDSYGYDDGVQQDVAVHGVSARSFQLEKPAEGHCAGAPVLGLDNQALGIHGGYVGGPTVQYAGAGGSVGTPAYRLDAILENAQQLLHTTLTLVPAGVKGVTSR